jgi:hypothetical protein
MRQHGCNKQLFIYINNFLEFYFLCENQGVTVSQPSPLKEITSEEYERREALRKQGTFIGICL